jgi:hypothetical protein
MISTPSPFSTTTAPTPLSANHTYKVHLNRSVSWGAISAGIAAALAMQVLFMLLGAGLGFAIYTPLTDANPIANLGAGALVVQGISAVFSLWFGGWVAGRFTPTGTHATGWLVLACGAPLRSLACSLFQPVRVGLWAICRNS